MKILIIQYKTREISSMNEFIQTLDPPLFHLPAIRDTKKHFARLKASPTIINKQDFVLLPVNFIHVSKTVKFANNVRRKSKHRSRANSL